MEARAVDWKQHFRAFESELRRVRITYDDLLSLGWVHKFKGQGGSTLESVKANQRFRDNWTNGFSWSEIVRKFNFTSDYSGWLEFEKARGVDPWSQVSLMRPPIPMRFSLPPATDNAPRLARRVGRDKALTFVTTNSLQRQKPSGPSGGAKNSANSDLPRRCRAESINMSARRKIVRKLAP